MSIRSGPRRDACHPHRCRQAGEEASSDSGDLRCSGISCGDRWALGRWRGSSQGSGRRWFRGWASCSRRSNEVELSQRGGGGRLPDEIRDDAGLRDVHGVAADHLGGDGASRPPARGSQHRCTGTVANHPTIIVCRGAKLGRGPTYGRCRRSLSVNGATGSGLGRRRAGRRPSSTMPNTRR
jgi:hypothetical protein